jgi:RNAse (barnase) inhibitor barstar
VENVELSGSEWRSADDFYHAYLAAVGAPDWHGHNLDALWDSLTGGDINRRNPPLHIRITGTAQMDDDAREIVRRFADLITEAREGGCSVTLELKP